MPIHLKVIVSAVILIVALAVFWYDTSAGVGGPARWIALAVGPFAVFGIWVFPEPKTKTREIRKAAAEKQSERAAERG